LFIAIAESLPIAVGVALSPLPVAALLIMLLTPRAKRNGPAFLAGWILGIGSVGLIVFLAPGIETSRGEPTRLAGLVGLLIGAALIALSVQQWRKRPAPDQPIEVPEMLGRLDQMGVAKAVLAGFLLSALNPKNLGLTAAGVATIDASMLGPADQAIVFALFTVVASAAILLPMAGFLVYQRRAEVLFARWKDWLIVNNSSVLAVLLLVFGVVILGRGIAIATS